MDWLRRSISRSLEVTLGKNLCQWDLLAIERLRDTRLRQFRELKDEMKIKQAECLSDEHYEGGFFDNRKVQNNTDIENVNSQ